MSAIDIPNNDNEPVSVAERVFTRLRVDILEGRIAPGSKISEPELAKAYGVSRGSLREAIARLVSCNLVERQPNIGARVITLSNECLLEIYHAREALEGMAARLAASCMSDQEVTRLEALLELHRQSLSASNSQPILYQNADFDFHMCIIMGSHNQRLIRILHKDLYDLIRFYRYRFRVAGPRPDQVFVEHGGIVSAIKRGDAEMAELMMRNHIRASREHAKNNFNNDQTIQINNNKIA